MADTVGDIAADYVTKHGFALIALQERAKVPATTNGLKDWSDDPDGIRQWFTAHPRHNVAVVCGKPSNGLIIIDFDVDADLGYDGLAELYKWEDEHGPLPETATVITGRGGMHLYYRSSQQFHPSVNDELHIDLRADGSYAMLPPSIHPNGSPTYWDKHPDDVGIAEADANVLAFIAHISGGDAVKRKKFHLPNEIGKGKRNDTLTRYGCSLQARSEDDDVIRAFVESVNKTKCKPPLPQSEVDSIVESVLAYPKGLSEEAMLAKALAKRNPMRSEFRKPSRNGGQGAVLHNVVARELIDNHKSCFVDGAPAIWDGERYAAGWNAVSKEIIKLIDDCKMADQREIRNYVNLMAPHVKSMDPWIIPFANGALDIRRGLMEYTEDMVFTNIIPHEFDASAQCEDVDRFLDRISNHDPTTRDNLEEVIGICMYRANDFGQCPVLIGSGSNGKSTFITALRNVLGTDNVSSLDINIIGKPFQAGRLLGKLANLGDDISNERLNGDILAVFKKIVTGDWIYTDVKNGDGFEFKPYCTLVFSCNEFPRIGDSSDGMMRRLFPIPFDARFSRNDPDYDPRITDKLTTEEAAKYLIKLGIRGLRRVMRKNGFTENSRSETIAEEVKLDNDNVAQWIDDEGVTARSVTEKETSLVYDDYCRWCRANGAMHYGKTKFSHRLRNTFGVRTVSARSGNRVSRVYRLETCND